MSQKIEKTSIKNGEINHTKAHYEISEPGGKGKILKAYHIKVHIANWVSEQCWISHVRFLSGDTKTRSQATKVT